MTDIEYLELIWKHLASFFGGNEEKANLWIRTPNPLLGGISPDQMVKAGRAKKLYEFIKQQVEDDEA